jgi:hypothetical protein
MRNYMFMIGAGDNTGGAGGNTGWGAIQVVVIALQLKMKENKKNKKEKVYNSWKRGRSSNMLGDGCSP